MFYLDLMINQYISSIVGKCQISTNFPNAVKFQKKNDETMLFSNDQEAQTLSKIFPKPVIKLESENFVHVKTNFREKFASSVLTQTSHSC